MLDPIWSGSPIYKHQIKVTAQSVTKCTRYEIQLNCLLCWNMSLIRQRGDTNISDKSFSYNPAFALTIDLDTVFKITAHTLPRDSRLETLELLSNRESGGRTDRQTIHKKSGRRRMPRLNSLVNISTLKKSESITLWAFV